MATHEHSAAPSAFKEFAALWVEAHPRLAAYISAVVWNAHDADDVLQKVAVVAFRRAADYDPDTPYFAWVAGIARHELMHWRRTKARDRHVFTSDTIASLQRAQARIEPELNDRRNAIKSCVSKLDPSSRNLVEMRYRDDAPYEQIADVMGVAAATLRGRLVRIRKRLAECIQRQLRMEHPYG